MTKKQKEAVIEELILWIKNLENFDPNTGYFGKHCSSLNLKMELLRLLKEKVRRLSDWRIFP